MQYDIGHGLLCGSIMSNRR